MDPVLIFAQLFQGRLEVIGHEEGRCIKVENPTWQQFLVHMEDHLFGDNPYGVYPLTEVDGEAAVRWGCVDFDTGIEAGLIHGQNVRSVLHTFGIEGWIEISRSKGTHLFVFFDGWMPAKLVREALIGACETVQAPIDEVNPKQTDLRGIGNYVRLPYPNGYNEKQRRVMIEPSTLELYSLEEFLMEAPDLLCSLEQLQQLHTLYKPPAKPKPPKIEYIPDTNGPRGMKALSRHILANGPKETGDRSGALYALAQSLHRDGLTRSEALAILYEADQRWGKYIARDGDTRYIDKMADKVWG